MVVECLVQDIYSHLLVNELSSGNMLYAADNTILYYTILYGAVSEVIKLPQRIIRPYTDQDNLMTSSLWPLVVVAFRRRRNG